MISTYAQTRNSHYYTEAFDNAFRNISRVEVTTGILYERVLPFARLYNFNSNIYPLVDTSNLDHFIQAYSELYEAAFLPSKTLPMNSDNVKPYKK
jgi:hypothetical protein